MTDTTRPDHAAEARDAIEALQRYNGDDDAYMAAHAHLTALAGERDRYRDALLAALERYDRTDAENGHRGFVRESVAWAMADDLRQALMAGAEEQRDE